MELLSDPELARALGQSGRERVRNHYLLPRLLLDELALLVILDHDEPAGWPRVAGEVTPAGDARAQS
jgi:trehalose synthase